MREYLRTSGPGLRPLNLPGCRPGFNADEGVWGWVKEQTTGNLRLGTKALVHENVINFLGGLARRKDKVKRRCRVVLQSKAEEIVQDSQPNSRGT